MKQSGRRARHRKAWSHWLLWWKIDQDELRREADGVKTPGMIISARRLGSIVAIAAGTLLAAMGGFYLWTAAYGWIAMGKRAGGWAGFIQDAGGAGTLTLGVVAFATGLLMVIVGSLVYRGSRAAIRGMMALWTIYLVFLAVGEHPYLQPKLQAVGMLAALLVWTCGLHVLYVALRVEQRRKLLA